MKRQPAALLYVCALVGFACSSLTQAQSSLPLEATSAYQMTAKATAFLGLLDTTQRNRVMFSLDSNERGRWSNLPTHVITRTGLPLGDLTEAQRIALHELLRVSLSSQGYLKLAGVMRMDQTLSEWADNPPPGLLGVERGAPWPGPIGEGPEFPPELAAGLRDEMQRIRSESIESAGDRGNVTRGFGIERYYVSVFGAPSTSSDWAYLIGGHHLAASFTVSGGRVSFTPLFMGSQPLMLRRGLEAGWSPLYHESAKGFDLMEALSEDQQRVAQVSADRTYDVVAGPGRRDVLTGYEGLKASDMTPPQRRLLRALVEEFVRNAKFDTANAHLAAIEDAGWDELWFSWRGPIGDPNDIFYYRVHGPRILIEYAWERWNHVHTIVRDPANDYGEDWLGRHYRELHPDSSRLTELSTERMEFIRDYLEENGLQAIPDGN